MYIMIFYKTNKIQSAKEKIFLLNYQTIGKKNRISYSVKNPGVS
jgi:hypothetical protein